MLLRDRIRDFRRLDPNTIRPNPRNWRLHPDRQRSALRGLLAEIGIVGAVLVRALEDGTFILIDGHLRAEEVTGQPVPALILDITAEEEAEILATYDPVGDLAETDHAALNALLVGFESQNPAVQELCASLRAVDPTAGQQSLDDLEEQFGGETDEQLFWQEVKLKVPQDVYDRFQQLMDAIPLETTAQKFAVLVAAVDEGRVPALVRAAREAPQAEEPAEA